MADKELRMIWAYLIGVAVTFVSSVPYARTPEAQTPVTRAAMVVVVVAWPIFAALVLLKLVRRAIRA